MSASIHNKITLPQVSTTDNKSVMFIEEEDKKVLTNRNSDYQVNYTNIQCTIYEPRL